MEASLRPIVISFELIILMAIIYSLLTGLNLAIFDFGVNQKYRKFIQLALVILGCLALVFLVSHLIAFYPRFSHRGG